MHGALEGVLQGVGCGEGAELGEHNVAHADAIDVALDQHALGLHVRGDKDERAHDGDPQVADQESGDDQSDGDPLAQARAQSPP